MGGLESVWLTPGWIDIGYVGVMCLAPSEQTDTRWTAQSGSDEVVGKSCAFLCHMLDSQWHIGHRIQLQILVICHYEEKVGL